MPVNRNFTHSSTGIRSEHSNKQEIESRRFRVSTAIALASLIVPTAIWWFADDKPPLEKPAVSSSPSKPQDKISQSVQSSLEYNKYSGGVYDFESEREIKLDSELTQNIVNYTDNSQINNLSNLYITNNYRKIIADTGVSDENKDIKINVFNWCKELKISSEQDCDKRYKINLIVKELNSDIEQFFANGYPVLLPLTNSLRDKLSNHLANGDGAYLNYLRSLPDVKLLNEAQSKSPGIMQHVFAQFQQKHSILFRKLVSLEEKMRQSDYNSESIQSNGEVIDLKKESELLIDKQNFERKRVEYLESLSLKQLREDLKKYQVRRFDVN